jgi:hypothetical protein
MYMREFKLVSWIRRCIFILLALSIFLLSVSSTSYLVREDETGWTTGLRSSMNVSLEISGFVLGNGNYSRYTEIDVNDVRMRERVSAKDGTLDTEERINLSGEETDPWESELVKLPGTQDYTLTVNETWPVSLKATRSIDYIGKGINDREIFGNNLDYIGSQHLYTTDFRKDRACDLYLKNAWFEALLNDTTNAILKDVFQPEKTTEYNLNSYSTGLAILKYRAALGKEIASEGEERYDGTFSIRRHILTVSPGRENETDSEEDWLECCPGSNFNLTKSQRSKFLTEGTI